MNKNLLIGVVVLLVLLGGYMAISGKEQSETPAELTDDRIENPTGKKMAFSEFIKQGGSYRCEVHQAMSDMENEGEVFVDGNKIRGDFTTIAEGREMSSSFILSDGYTYNWSSMAPNMGVKMKMNEDTEAGGRADATYSWNAEQVGDYNCEAWTADPMKFALPAGVSFTEVGREE